MTIEYEPSEIYRGVAIHNFQTKARIEERVKPQIDYVLSVSDVAELFCYCGDISCPPEARLMAGAMLEAIFAAAADDRRVRPDIDLEKVRARTAGLEQDSHWRSNWVYGCAFDVEAPGSSGPKSEKRPEPLTDEHLALRRR